MRTDPLTTAQRSERMSRIRSSDTKPEIAVRRLIYSMGYRYRLHSKDVPGRPDIVFKGRKKVVFVHGCFWHQHGCRQYRMPKSKLDFWLPKLENNIQRDKKVLQELKESGWNVLIIWECELKDKESVCERIKYFMEQA
ncbi:DNA mismatch endonuclease Vsr [uncultured Desulfuromonas sp.]|uniref:very short patch repair endonuclease n=1 Tax=uncultured Desulfuromonas sp. TaxID=181013 RepID=UPI002AAB045A|nr:DNA mismatch endonuclease Vsr [uncultured Desulfuromonas sp.]